MDRGLRVVQDAGRTQREGSAWLNIELGGQRVGKMRVAEAEETMTIYSIQIFPGYQGRGLARRALDGILESHETVIADRVRPAAVGFWRKLGFAREGGQRFRYTKRSGRGQDRPGAGAAERL